MMEVDKRTAYAVSGSMGGKTEQVSNGLIPAFSVPKAAGTVKSRLTSLEQTRALELTELLESVVYDMPLEPGGSAVFQGEESGESCETRRYFCVIWETPMTEQAAVRITRGLSEVLEAAQTGR